jgi:DNA polymerase III delta subunit
MITLIHGDDIVTSRNYFLEEKKKYLNSPIYNGKDLEAIDLIELLQPKNLFFEKQAVFIENLFLKKELFSKLKDSKIDVFLWEGKEITSAELIKLKPEVKLFKLPQALFSFLDSIRPNSPQNVSLFRNALKNTTEDMIFYMLIRQFRLLLSVSEAKDGIDEVKRLAPWQKTKLTKQASLFTKDQLKKIYSKLYKMDLDVKTGEIESLTPSIDFLLLEI